MALGIILRGMGRLLGKSGKVAGKATKKIGAGAAKLGSVAMLAKGIFGGNKDENDIQSAGTEVSKAAEKVSSTDGVSEHSSNLAKSLKIYSIGLQNSISEVEDAKSGEEPIPQTTPIPSIITPPSDGTPQSGFSQFIQQEPKALEKVQSPTLPLGWERDNESQTVIQNVQNIVTQPLSSGFSQFVQQEAKVLNSVRENEEARIRASETSRNNDPLGLLLKGIKASAAQLEDNSEGNIDDIRRENLKAKRENEEKKLEGGMFSDAMENVFGKIKGFAGNVKNGILAALMPFAPAAALLAGGLLMDKADGGDDEELDLESVLDNVDKTAERVAQLAAPAIIRNTVVGAQTKVSKRIDKINANKLGAKALNVGKSAGKATANVALKISAKVKPTSARYQKIAQNLLRAKNWMVRAGQEFNKTTASAQNALKKLPRPIRTLLGKVGRFAFRWFMFIEILDFMWRSTQSLIMGSITKEEWHKGNKEQLYKLIKLFGAPIVGMIILGLAGTPIMGLGGIVGAGAGLILGVILGESLFYALNMEALVNGFYDAFFLGKWSTLIGYAPALIKRLAIELPMLLGKAAVEGVKAAISMSPVVLAIKASRDEIASEEEITAEYGEGISNAELLQKAGEGMGTDENAILYAFKDIDTPEKYIALKNEFEETALPKINENRIRKLNTMEQYLRKELSGGEYKQLMQQVGTQMRENTANEASVLNQFFDDVGYEYEEPVAVEETPEQIIPGINDATAEQIEQYNRGELVDVIVDNKKVLMTREQLREADIPRVFKREARREADMRRRRYQEGQSSRPETNDEETPVTNLDRTAEDLQGTNNYLRDMAARMGLETSGDITGKLVGGVPVEINGQRVPLSLFTTEERQKIRAAEETRRAMEPVTPRQGEVTSPELQQTQKGVVQNNELATKQIIPNVSRLSKNINILNKNQLTNQRQKTPPAGTEGMSSVSSATPTRKTSDPFIEIAYMT